MLVGGKMSDKNLEQRINIMFFMKIGKSASETLALLTVVYGEYAMKKLSVFEWHSPFKEEGEDMQADPRSGSQKRKGQMQMWTEYSYSSFLFRIRIFSYR
jgi:hypothetical protein